jgi:hypothetical protein
MIDDRNYLGNEMSLPLTLSNFSQPCIRFEHRNKLDLTICPTIPGSNNTFIPPTDIPVGYTVIEPDNDNTPHPNI